MAHHQLTNAEMENKVAFFVQLNALLTQIHFVVKSEALSSAQRAKLSDLCSATEAWLNDVSAIKNQCPSTTDSLPLRPSATELPGLAPGTVAAGVQPDEEQAEDASTSVSKAAAEGPLTTAATSTGEAASAEAPSSADASGHAPPSLASSGRFSFSAEVTASHKLVDERNLAGLANYLRLLFNGDLPERAKLQTFGKSLGRLLMVRCCSMIMASLQHVVHHTYTGTDSTGEATLEDGVEAAVSPHFVQFAKEINVATRTMLACIQLVTTNAVPSDAASARFPMQLCVDVVKQTRRAQMCFQTRIEKEELHLLQKSIMSTSSAAKPAEGSIEDVDAAPNAFEEESPERMATYAQRRIDALRRQWGPSLVHSVRNIGSVIKPCVKFLTLVAAVRAEGAPAPLLALKKDAAQDLCSLCRAAMPAAAPARGETGLAKLSSTSDLAAVGASPSRVGDTAPLTWRTAASDVVTNLGSSFSADYLAAVATCCGDSNEGQLLATRLFTDMLQYVAAHDVPLLRCVLLGIQWYRAVYDGILSCVASAQPAVLAAGLEALGLLITTCPLNIGQEVGFLYTNVVLRLLDSPNSPYYVKRTIALHLLMTFMTHNSTVPAGGDRGSVPLIFHLYRLYDLNVHAHGLNLMQQLTNTLSRIVRAAPKEELMQDANVQEQPRLQQEASSSVPAPSAPASVVGAQSNETQRRAGKVGSIPSSEPSSTAAVPNLASFSLPAMALYGLVRIAELTTTEAPLEEESGKAMFAELPVVTCRESKLKEQQEVDLFNAAPKRTIYRLFNITAEENTVPVSHANFSIQWEHKLLPPLPSAASMEKVEAVADFLSQTSSLNPEAVAEFLTTPEMFPLHVCAAYLGRLPLAGCSVLEAINELLMRVQLPKEGQRIERLLEYFAAAYYKANSVGGIDRDVFPFKSDTAVFIFIVATVMLNTNVHNPSAGTKLDRKAFRSQLRCCNDDESFADSFVDEIFFCISTRPLESVKGVTVNATASTESAGRSAFDMFFVSQEEKRQLAFGVEVQRMVSETQQLLRLHTCQMPLAPAPGAWWCAVVKDFFLSTWSSVCAVFGPAMYEGTTTTPLNVLLPCVRGLQSLLHTAAAFDLSTECTVTLLTLLRMSEVTPVQEHCWRAVLVVASMTHAMNFPVRCWVAVCQLMLEVRRTSTATTPPLIEDVFTRVERITRLSIEADDRGAPVDVALKTNRPKEAIRRVMEGIMTTISSYAVGDVASLSSALVVLRRALEFTRIVHGKQAMDIVYFVNAREFTTIVVPAYLELVKKHSSSDDGLQLLFECVVDLMCTMWVSYSTHRTTAPASAAEKAEAVATTVHTAPAEFLQSFRCLRNIYDVTLPSASDEAATLLQMHTLQAVKEVLSRILRAAEMMSADHDLSLRTMMTSWQEVLYPLAMALCDRNSTATEAGSLALLVLRKLVALCGGTGSASSDRLSVTVRGALLWLLAQLAYMGGMCGDADSAQVCVALLSSICTATVAMSATAASSSLGWSATVPVSPAIALADPITFAQLLEQRDAFTHEVVVCMETNPNYVVRDTLARLCSLLLCEREQTRAEVVHQLRTLSLQMRPGQLSPLVLDLAVVVLEGTIGHTEHHHTTPITHSSILPFLFFQIPMPASMRRCSQSSFRATLPTALGLLSNELLTGLKEDDLPMAAQSVMQRCLLPILLSPKSPYQSRFLAVRSLSRCIAVCLQQKSAALSPRLAQCVLDCLALALYAVRVPLTAIVLPDTNFVGRRWLETPMTNTVSAWEAYCAQATHTVELMSQAEPQWLVGGAGAEAPEAALGTCAATAIGEQNGQAANPTLSRGRRAGNEETRRAVGAALVPDEPLIEYVNMLVQILAGVPKELQNVVTSAAAAGSAEKTSEVIEDSWALPHASPLVLLQLCLQAAGTLFAVLWRINHPCEVEQYALQSIELRREAPAFTRNSGLLPHAAVRSVLQCYLKFAILASEYPSDDLLAVTTDIIEAIRQVQTISHTAAPPSFADGGGAGAVTAASDISSLAADTASLQRLSPQEQQHVRACNSGMYQQLTTVLGYLVELLTGQSASVAGWTSRQEAFEAMVLHPKFFALLVPLLTPTAGTLITTVRDYFAWYIAHAPLPSQENQAAGTTVAAMKKNICSPRGGGKFSPTPATESDDENPPTSNLPTVNGTSDGNGHVGGSNGYTAAESATPINSRAEHTHAQIPTQSSHH
ncbi:hypothetical protein JKF63_06374 [Porcisia hertigi]|uniref:SEC7 domain-containing protein n=1 Tax=Porcisia hertigi TaxID=2761500 RepID=A0A836YIP9_9TRYP|nr:hypothetical protein JKF63_06374 [Porcisia hertigi]